MNEIYQMQLLSIDEILDCPPATIAMIIAPALHNIDVKGDDFPWLALADVSNFKSSKCQISNQLDLALQWAVVAAMIYDCLAQHVTGSALRSIDRKAMGMRAELIRLLGHRDCDPVLDSGIIERWFFDRNTLSLVDVQSIRNYEEQEAETLWHFDQLLDRFRVLLRLLDAGYFSRHPQLHLWKSAIELANANLA